MFLYCIFAEIIHTMKKPIIDLGTLTGCTHYEIDPRHPFKTGVKLEGVKPMYRTVKAKESFCACYKQDLEN